MNGLLHRMTSSRNISFNSSAATPASMFSCRMTSSPTIYVVVHVDDILIFGNQASWNAALTHVWPRAMKLRISANPVISWVSQSSRSDIPRSAHSRHYHPSSRLWGPTKVRNGLTNLISRLASPLSAPAPSKTLATPPPNIPFRSHALPPAGVQSYSSVCSDSSKYLGSCHSPTSLSLLPQKQPTSKTPNTCFAIARPLSQGHC